jgi:hypothetical protein
MHIAVIKPEITGTTIQNNSTKIVRYFLMHPSESSTWKNERLFILLVFTN